jgi:hypothetical protein
VQLASSAILIEIEKLSERQIDRSELGVEQEEKTSHSLLGPRIKAKQKLFVYIKAASSSFKSFFSSVLSKYTNR